MRDLRGKSPKSGKLQKTFSFGVNLYFRLQTLAVGWPLALTRLTRSRGTTRAAHKRGHSGKARWSRPADPTHFKKPSSPSQHTSKQANTPTYLHSLKSLRRRQEHSIRCITIRQASYCKSATPLGRSVHESLCFRVVGPTTRSIAQPVPGTTRSFSNAKHQAFGSVPETNYVYRINKRTRATLTWCAGKQTNTCFCIPRIQAKVFGVHTNYIKHPEIIIRKPALIGAPSGNQNAGINLRACWHISK
jgi:hypothetical protein